MPKTYRSASPQSASESAAWEAMGLSDALDQCIDGETVRNEWPSEHGDSSGEVYATMEDYAAPDGHTYHLLFTSDWSNSWSPWTDTHATLYRTDSPADMEEYARDVAEWEAKPETDPDYPTDDDPEDLVDDCEPHGVEVGHIDTIGDDEEEEDIPDDGSAAPDGWDAIDTSTEDSESHDS